MILVLPSGFVSLLLLATILDLYIEWKVFITSMLSCHSIRWCGCYVSSICYSIVTMTLTWIWGICLYWVGDVSLYSCHEVVFYHSGVLGLGLGPHLTCNMIWNDSCYHTYSTFCQMLGIPCMHVSCYIYYKFYLCYLFVNCLLHLSCHFLPPFFLCLNISIAFIVVGWVIPPFDLWQLKSFTVISCSLAYWSSVVYVTSSRIFFDWTHFLTLKHLVTWNNSSVLHTSFSASVYWHFSTRFFICWSS